MISVYRSGETLGEKRKLRAARGSGNTATIRVHDEGKFRNLLEGWLSISCTELLVDKYYTTITGDKTIKNL